jgi:hypothetical protein
LAIRRAQFNGEPWSRAKPLPLAPRGFTAAASRSQNGSLMKRRSKLPLAKPPTTIHGASSSASTAFNLST